MMKDPICGMEVDPQKAKFILEKDGKTYYFCSKGCYETFKNKNLDKNQTEIRSDNKIEKCLIHIEGMSCQDRKEFQKPEGSQ